MKKIFGFLLLFLIFSFSSVKSVSADANITLSPSSKSVNVNDEFSIDAVLDTAGSPSSGADFIMTWSPASAIEIQTADKVSYGTSPLFTSNTPSRDNTNGKMISISTMSVATNTFSGKGTLASITFKAKTEGTVTLTFECSSGSRSDTNIWSSGADIINCDQTSGATVTIAASRTTTTTPAPSAAPRGDPSTGGTTETKGGLPNSGALEVTLALGLGGGLLLIFGFFFPKLLKE